MPIVLYSSFVFTICQKSIYPITFNQLSIFWPHTKHYGNKKYFQECKQVICWSRKYSNTNNQRCHNNKQNNFVSAIMHWEFGAVQYHNNKQKYLALPIPNDSFINWNKSEHWATYLVPCLHCISYYLIKFPVFKLRISLGSVLFSLNSILLRLIHEKICYIIQKNVLYTYMYQLIHSRSGYSGIELVYLKGFVSIGYRLTAII